MLIKFRRTIRPIAITLAVALWTLSVTSGCRSTVDNPQLLPEASQSDSQETEATILVDVAETLGPVNRLLFGSSVLDVARGNGLMDGDYQFDPIALSLVRDLRPGLLRLGWRAIFEDAIGPQSLRHGPRCGWPDWATNEYGIDEHLALLEVIGAPGQAVVLVGYPIALVDSTDPDSCISEGKQSNLSQMVKRAMAWVAYANGDPADSTIIGVDDHGYDWGTVGEWAQKRVNNGHPEPYGIKYWEIGNEVYLRRDRPSSPEEYASEYIAFRNAMHLVDPTIIVSANARYEERFDSTWNEPLLAALDGNLDALTLHMYYPVVSGDAYGPTHDLALMAASSQADRDLARIRQLIASHVSQPDRVALLLGENGVHYGIEEDAVAWNRMIVGVYDADMLGLYVQRSSSYHLDLAIQHWLHGQSATADIHYTWATDERYRRPDYYALQMWTQHFGDMLINNTVNSATFDMPEQYGRVGPLYDIPYLAAHTSIAGDKLYLLVINRHLTDDITTHIDIRGFQPRPVADVYTLNGPSVYATNEFGDHDTVVITHTEISDAGADFTYVFPAHSVTAIELLRLETEVYSRPIVERRGGTAQYDHPRSELDRVCARWTVKVHRGSIDERWRLQ